MSAPTSRRAALVAGLGLLVMSLLAGIAVFGVLARLVVPDDADATVRLLEAHPTQLRLAVLALVGVAALDVVVAWALWEFFEPVDRSLAVLAGLLRVVYAAVYLVAIGHLAEADVATYERLWDVGLLVFGLHLAVVGVLALRSGLVPRVIGWLLVVAGAGYLIDSVGTLLSPAYDVEVSTVTFVGEVALFVWLLWWVWRTRAATRL